MGESRRHIVLVHLLVDWIAESLLNGDHGHIMIDSPDSSPQNKPPVLNSFIPDVFVSNVHNYNFIIGEAKTSNDVDSRHTIQQIDAFLFKCAESKDSVFVLAVPWNMVGLGTSILEYRKKKTGCILVKTKVLEKLAV